jgi:dihydroorotase
VFTDEALESYNTNYKLMPPLRSAADVEALCSALADGVIDCVATNHTPLTQEEKDVEFSLAPWGATALETTLALLYTELVQQGKMNLSRLVQVLSEKPAQLLGIGSGAGTLQPGSPADFTLVNLEQARPVVPAQMLSRSRNTPLNGRELRGWPQMTYVDGIPVWGGEGQ